MRLKKTGQVEKAGRADSDMEAEASAAQRLFSSALRLCRWVCESHSSVLATRAWLFRPVSYRKPEFIPVNISTVRRSSISVAIICRASDSGLPFIKGLKSTGSHSTIILVFHQRGTMRAAQVCQARSMDSMNKCISATPSRVWESGN
ncbi:unnamed protein product [Pleuronectes platessa]|uniref:Uncharacterized protein n=1 Tax=Pleuronectes platessa TaxID=8262 RepID=A0A9N7YMQ1_PLEPL|nr:unnamed protein product [Pleuronectes platessa]